MNLSLSKLRNFSFIVSHQWRLCWIPFYSRANKSIASVDPSLAISWSIYQCLWSLLKLSCCRLIVSSWIMLGLFVLEFKIFSTTSPIWNCRLRASCFRRLIIGSKPFNHFSLIIIWIVFAFWFVFVPIFICWLERKLVLRLIVICDTLLVLFLRI